MKKLMVLSSILVSLLIISLAMAQKTQIEISPKFPTFGNQHRQNDPWAPGSWMNPYQAKDKSTGQVWEIKPKYPDFGDRTGTFAPGSFLNPWTVEEK